MWGDLKLFSVFLFRIRTLLESGMPLLEAITLLISDESATLSQQKKLERFKSSLLAGESLGAALSVLLSGAFSARLELLPTGVELTAILKDLEHYFSVRDQALRVCLGKLIYPMVLVLSLLGLFFLFFTVLLPQYLAYYQDLGVKIPGVLLFLTDSKNSFFICSVFLLCFVVAGWGGYRFTKGLYGASPSDLLWMLALQLKYGVPLDRALGAVSVPIQYSARWVKLRKAIGETGQFSQSWASVFFLNGYYKGWISHLEKDGTLYTQLLLVSQQWMRDTLIKQSRFLTFLPGVLLVVIGTLLFLLFYFSYQPFLLTIQTLNI